jgi:hypothetical protein
MSTVAGAFDETLLMNVIVRADQMLFDDRIKQQYIPKYDALKALMSIQNARVMTPLSFKKDYDVEIEWMNACEVGVEDNTSCELGGVEASTNVEQYAISYEKVSNFSVDETKFQDNRFDKEEAIAKLFLAADKKLVENFTEYTLTKLNTFLGQNEMGTEGKGVVDGTTTWIKPVYWSADLMAYFHRAAKKNSFSNPILLSGSNLYEQVWLAAAKVGNADGKGDFALFGSIPMAFDLDNIDSVNDDQTTYMIQTGALAFANKAVNPDVPEIVPGVFTRYTMSSKFMPNFKYDVFYKPECTTGDMVIHHFKVKLKADVFANPVGCTATNTGFLAFACGEPAN